MTKLASYKDITTLSERIDRVERRPSAWDSSIDGRITRGDVLVGFLAILLLSFAGLAIGTGLGIILSKVWRGIVLGVGIGMTIGGIVVGIRTVLDIARYKRPERIATDDPPRLMGIDVEVMRKTGSGTGTLLRGRLLPNIDRRLAYKMLRRAAIAVSMGKNFSKRQAGMALGEHFSDVQTEMLRLGLLMPAGSSPNAGYSLTNEGEQWLEKFLQ